MIKASELQEGQVVSLPKGDYKVITNLLDDVIFLCDDEAEEYTGFHLFYGDLEDVVYAQELGIDLC